MTEQERIIKIVSSNSNINQNEEALCDELWYIMRQFQKDYITFDEAAGQLKQAIKRAKKL